MATGEGGVPRMAAGDHPVQRPSGRLGSFIPRKAPPLAEGGFLALLWLAAPLKHKQGVKLH